MTERLLLANRLHAQDCSLNWRPVAQRMHRAMLLRCNAALQN
jgi:hypothetical protein